MYISSKCIDMFQLIYLSVFSVVFLPQLNCPVIDWCQEKGQISDKKFKKLNIDVMKTSWKASKLQKQMAEWHDG